MSKKVRWILIAIAGAVAATVLIVWLTGLKTEDPPSAENTPEPTAATDVQVPINETQEDAPVYEIIEDAETGEDVPAQVQENVPPQPKPTAPPEKPESDGDYTNPDTPPAYTEDQIVVTAAPKEQEAPKEQNTDQAPSGYVYVEGFGYVPEAGEAQTQPGYSEGDINKQVGSMD